MTVRRDPLDHLVLVMGAMKSGTTSLHAYMDLHPQVSMARWKEPSFFVDQTRGAQTMASYRANLRKLRPAFADRALVWGESSTNYAKFPMFKGVPQRISAAAPNTRFVYALRDPVRRVLSHYIHNVANGRETRPIDEALADPGPSNNYVATSMYWMQLEQYLQVFERERFLVLSFDDITKNTSATMRRVYAHIGVDPGFESPDFGRVLNDSQSKGAPNELGRVVMKLPGGKAIRAALSRFTEVPFERATLSADLTARLADALRPDAERLRAELGVSFAGWTV